MSSRISLPPSYSLIIVIITTWIRREGSLSLTSTKQTRRELRSQRRSRLRIERENDQPDLVNASCNGRYALIKRLSETFRTRSQLLLFASSTYPQPRWLRYLTRRYGRSSTQSFAVTLDSPLATDSRTDSADRNPVAACVDRVQAADSCEGTRTSHPTVDN